MFGIGLPELILIMAVALIVVGPEKLPELAKGLAKQMLELKKAANVLKESLRDDEPEKKDLDSDLPVGFSRPEELARAGRQASAIAHSSEPSVDQPADSPDKEESAVEPDDSAAANDDAPASDSVGTAEKEE